MREIRKLIQGNEAFVEADIMTGVRFFTEYPITPSSEITEGFSRRLPQVGGRFIQIEDEIVSVKYLDKCVNCKLGEFLRPELAVSVEKESYGSDFSFNVKSDHI